MTAIGWLCRALVITRKMSSNFTYKDAIQKLNSLQSNRVYLAAASEDKHNNIPSRSLEYMNKFIARVGITQSDLEKLSVIHVAGTKGKGSTCAMCESILRHHGYTTGFFSSPHLVSICERIRLNGKMISEERFADYFNKVYSILESTKAHEADMPNYFGMTVVLAFYIFLEEKVDVAVIEVGIGGTYDFTNILRKVPVVGITSLGIDHTSLLGSTLQEIALAKAGIMKKNCHAFTVDQRPEAMEVLEKVAKDVKCPLSVVPHFQTYSIPELRKQTEFEINIYNLNASLAIQMAHAWMQKCGIPKSNGGTAMENKLSDNANSSFVTSVTKETITGLQNLEWQGRFQLIKTDYADIYLDGAHTKESMEICAKWFEGVTSHRSSERILIFSLTGERNGEEMLTALKNIDFQKVYFVPPTAYKETDEKNDNFAKGYEKHASLAKCERNAEIWKKINEMTSTEVMDCVADALLDVNQFHTESQLLITGSIYLVGASLSILNPAIFNKGSIYTRFPKYLSMDSSR